MLVLQRVRNLARTVVSYAKAGVDVVAPSGMLDGFVAAYNVSGEYAMIEAAAEKGWIDRDRIVLETLTGIRRAGADMIISYHAPYACKLLQKQR